MPAYGHRQWDQPFSASLSALASENLALVWAAMVVGAPVCGLRPWRSGTCLAVNLPKPV